MQNVHFIKIHQRQLAALRRFVNKRFDETANAAQWTRMPLRLDAIYYPIPTYG